MIYIATVAKYMFYTKLVEESFLLIVWPAIGYIFI